MNENLKKFLEYASQNEDVRQKLNALNDETDKDTVIAKSIEIAKEAGFSLSAEDFAEEEPSGELSEDELDAVAGGKSCACAVFGGGTKSTSRFGDGSLVKDKTCGCVGYGQGDYETTHTDGTVTSGKRCSCPAVGEGV